MTPSRRGDLFDPACPTRQMLDRIGSKWVSMLVRGLEDDDEVRFAELRRRAPGISSKVLSDTLRVLERDGFVSRRVEATVPPAVHYALTPLGRSLVGPLAVLRDWAEEHMAVIDDARAAFDARSAGGGAVGSERQARPDDASVRLTRDLGPVLHRTVRDGAAHEPAVVPEALCRAVLDELATESLTALPPVEGPFGVRQEGEHLVLTGADIGSRPVVRDLHAAVVAAVHAHAGEIDGLARWVPDEITVQRYRPGSSGISVHRDGRRHQGLVAILTLEGSARLRQCSDREGTTVRSWEADAGSLVLLRGPGLAGTEDDRPLHAVDGPREHPRTSFTLRVAGTSPASDR